MCETERKETALIFGCPYYQYSDKIDFVNDIKFFNGRRPVSIEKDLLLETKNISFHVENISDSAYIEWVLFPSVRKVTFLIDLTKFHDTKSAFNVENLEKFMRTIPKKIKSYRINITTDNIRDSKTTITTPKISFPSHVKTIEIIADPDQGRGSRYCYVDYTGILDDLPVSLKNLFIRFNSTRKIPNMHNLPPFLKVLTICDDVDKMCLEKHISRPASLERIYLHGKKLVH